MDEIKKQSAVTKLYSIPFRGLGEMIFGAMLIFLSLYNTIFLTLIKIDLSLSQYGFIVVSLVPIIVLLSLFGVYKSRDLYFKRYGKVFNIKYILISTLLIIISMSIGTGVNVITRGTRYDLAINVASLFVQYGFIVIYINYLRYSVQYICVGIIYILLAYLNLNLETTEIVGGFLIFIVSLVNHLIIINNLKQIGEQNNGK